MKPKTGTREWSSSSVNVMSGCSNGCRYCYAKANAIRFGQHTRETWEQETERPGIREKRWGRRKGVIMFPTTHDITKSNLDVCLVAIEGMLNAGNRMLIVSKPSLQAITTLCKAIDEWKGSVTLRFTIGSASRQRLKFWEPNAPSFPQRMASLVWAWQEGWTTSVSMEPILDLDTFEVTELALMIEPYVTETIWIGTANNLRQRVHANCGKLDVTGEAGIGHLIAAWSPKAVKRLVTSVTISPSLRDKVRWKDSIKRVIGVPIEGES
jgi:DNA repair photolyase